MHIWLINFYKKLCFEYRMFYVILNRDPVNDNKRRPGKCQREKMGEILSELFKCRIDDILLKVLCQGLL